MIDNKVSTYIQDIDTEAEIVFLEKAIDGKSSYGDISEALDEYERLFMGGFSTPAEILTLARAYPNNKKYQKAMVDLKLEDNDDLVIGGPASVEIIDREGHLILTSALEPAFEKYMSNIRTRNAMVLHSDVQIGWALPAYISKSGNIFRSGVNDEGLFFITELRNDTKISERVREQIAKGEMQSYSIAGSAIETETVKKGLLDVMQVNKLELAEVTICQKGVNQEASFEILKADEPATTSCIDGSCLLEKEETCDCNIEKEVSSSTPIKLIYKDGRVDYFNSFHKWINKGSVNGEDFDYSDAGLQEAIDYATGLMRNKEKVVFEWEDYEDVSKSKELNKWLKKQVTNPFAVATAQAKRMGYKNFKEGSSGDKKRDKIAEALKKFTKKR